MNLYSKRRGPVTLPCPQPGGCTFSAVAATWRPAKRALAEHTRAGVHEMPEAAKRAPRRRRPKSAAAPDAEDA